MKKNKILISILLVSCIFCEHIFGAIGETAQINGVAIQSGDQKIVAAGTAVVSGQKQFAIIRYDTDGTLDTTGFGSPNGYVTTAIEASTDCQAHAVAVQTDGKIVVVGESGGKFAVARYTSAGVLDTAFDTDGKVATTIGSRATAYAVAIQSDGNIVVAGSAMVSNKLQIAVARYSGTDGSLDTTGFGSPNGYVTTEMNLRAEARAVAVQSDGKIVIAGWSANPQEQFAVVRYTTGAALDTTFDTDGKVITSIGGFFDRANSVAIQTDGNIVAGGVARMSTSLGNADQFALVRYASGSGALDTAFDTDGKVTTSLEVRSRIKSIAIQSDGKIVVLGYSNDNIEKYSNQKDKFALARYSTAGALDTAGFGSPNGYVTTRIFSESQGNAIGVQSDGKIVAGGWADSDVALARYSSAGVLDTTFGYGPGGISTLPGGSIVTPGSETFIWDQKSDETDGGTSPDDDWARRDLNQIAGKQGNVSLDSSNSTFTVQPGEYKIYASAPAYGVKRHQIRLYNTTDSVVEKYGTSEYCDEEDNNVEIVTRSFLEHHLVTTKTLTFRIDHFTRERIVGEGFGQAAKSGGVEIYTQVRVAQLS